MLSAATDTNGFVLFACGYNGLVAPYNKTNVDRYDLAGNMISLSPTLVSHQGFKAINDANGNPLFGTGASSPIIERYDSSGVRDTFASLSEYKYQAAAARNGNGKALFAGGYNTTYNQGSPVVEEFDAIGTRTTRTLSVGRRLLTGATDGNGDTLFAGGFVDTGTGIYNNYATVEKFNKDTGNRSLPTQLQQQRHSIASATNKNGDVFFAGGAYSVPYPGTGSVYAVVDKYDKSGARTSAQQLQTARSGIFASTDGNGNAIFAGGAAQGPVYSNVVDCYDADTGARTSLKPLNLGVDRGGAATDGNGAILCGGGIFTGSTPIYTDKVQRYNITSKKTITVPAYNAYKFQEYTQEHPASTVETRVLVNSPNEGYFRQVNGEITLADCKSRNQRGDREKSRRKEQRKKSGAAKEEESRHGRV